MADKSATARDYRAERDGKSWVIKSPSTGVFVLENSGDIRARYAGRCGSVRHFSTQSEADELARDINNRSLWPGDYFARYFGRG